MKAGFIGTGSMGAPLAANLLDQEKSLVVYDINPEATVKLAEKQARIVDCPLQWRMSPIWSSLACRASRVSARS